jgi:hypothetical protein
MEELEEGTCGFVLEAGDPKYDCQICLAKLEQEGRFACEANAGDYEFVADSGERVFVCAACFEKLFTPEK